MTRPGIEPRSPGPLANTLTAGPMSRYYIYILYIYIYNDFKSNPECRLINPAKTQIGRVSKIIVPEICDSHSLALNINQWRSTENCIKLFEEYEKNDRCPFIKYDIKDFYPSITEKTLDRALDLVKEYMVIPLDKVEIIKHCRKTLLYYEDSIWIKKKGRVEILTFQ